MPDYLIEKIDKTQLPRVQKLAQIIWPECFAGILDEALIPQMVEKIYDLQTLEEDILLRQHIYWICSINGKDVGYVSAYIEGARLWIKKLYLAKETRGLGIGKAMIETAKAQFRGAKSMALYVNDGNLPSIAFYKSQGFAIVETTPVIMGGFEFTDYVMEKAL